MSKYAYRYHVSLFSKWFGIVKSVLASFLGVQTHQQYEKDAQMPSFVPFLVVGVVMVVIFLMTIWLIVNLIL